jgi:N-acetylglucosamine-6-phosphate deacetylase
MELPGLIDLQVNGFKGIDFSGAHLNEEDVVRACRELLDAGTTAFLATLITSPTEIYERNLPLIARVAKAEEFKGRLLGIHLEGPFLSPVEGARGAHNPKWMRPPSLEYLDRLVAWAGGTVKMLTLAADLDGAEELIRHATKLGIVVSLGHHMANEDQLKRCAAAGAKALTHLGNGVPALLPRHENPVWAALANDDLAATIIPDGHHLPASLLKTIIRTKSPASCIVISDASELAGLAPGRYESMGAEVLLDPTGRLYNPATGYMAGSSATLLTCMNHLASLNLVTYRELLAMAFDNPLRLLGIDRRQVPRDNVVSYDERRHLFTAKTA